MNSFDYYINGPSMPLTDDNVPDLLVSIRNADPHRQAQLVNTLADGISNATVSLREWVAER